MTGDKNSLLSQHCAQNSHEFDLDDKQIVAAVRSGREDCFQKRGIRCVTRILLMSTVQIPYMYTILVNPKEDSRSSSRLVLIGA